MFELILCIVVPFLLLLVLNELIKIRKALTLSSKNAEKLHSAYVVAGKAGQDRVKK